MHINLSDKIAFLGLVAVAVGGGWTGIRSFVSYRRRVAQDRCAQCHSDSKRDIDNLKAELVRQRKEYTDSIGRVERQVEKLVSDNRDDHKRIHERIDKCVENQ